MKSKNDVSDLCQALALKYGLILSEKGVFPFKLVELQFPEDLSLSGDWFVRFYVWSVSQESLVLKRKRIPGKTILQKKTEAARIKNEVNKLLKMGVYIEPDGSNKGNKEMPLATALLEFMTEKQLTLKRQSFATYEKWIRYFLEFLEAKKYEEMAIQNFTPAHANEMRIFALVEQKMGNKTFNSYKGFVSGIFNHYKDIANLNSNPVGKTIKKLPTKTSKHLSYNSQQVQEYKRICLDTSNDHLWFFCCFLYYTFTRPHEEARNIRIADIKDDHIVIYADTSKTNHRTVMIPAGLEDIFTEKNIRDYPPHFYLFSHENKPGPTVVGRTYFYDRHVKILKEMGLYKHGYDLYGWKHTGAIALYRSTKDLMLVKEQCGHSDISQTVEYLRDLGVFHYSKEIHKFPSI